jgi:hypothetical protein
LFDYGAHPFNDRTGHPFRLRRIFYHNPVPGLIVFGRRGAAGYLQEFCKLVALDRFAFVIADRPTRPQQLLSLDRVNRKLFAKWRALITIQPIQVQGACRTNSGTVAAFKAVFLKIVRRFRNVI